MGSFLLQTKNVNTHPKIVETGSQLPSLSCPICMGPLKEETSTKCGHIFCKMCIDAAIKVQHKCPTCRGKLRMRDTIRIYLFWKRQSSKVISLLSQHYSFLTFFICCRYMLWNLFCVLPGFVGLVGRESFS